MNWYEMMKIFKPELLWEKHAPSFHKIYGIQVSEWGYMSKNEQVFHYLLGEGFSRDSLVSHPWTLVEMRVAMWGIVFNKDEIQPHVTENLTPLVCPICKCLYLNPNQIPFPVLNLHGKDLRFLFRMKYLQFGVCSRSCLKQKQEMADTQTTMNFK